MPQTKPPVPASSDARQAILEASMRAFARDGFSGTSLPAIALEVGVAKPLMYYYFKSKENLWREVIDYSLSGLVAETALLCSATRGLAPLDRLRALINAIAAFAARTPDHFVMLMAEARSNSNRFEWVQEHYSGIVFHRIIEVLEDAQAEGKLLDVASEQLATILVGAIFVRYSFQSVGVRGVQADQSADEFASLLFRLVEGISGDRTSSH